MGVDFVRVDLVGGHRQTLPGRKGLVQCLTWICIAKSAHRQLTKYLSTATVFDHSFHTSGVQGAKLFRTVPIITTATYHTPNYLWGVDTNAR